MDYPLPFTQFIVIGLGGVAALSLLLAAGLRAARALWRRGRTYITVQDVPDGNPEAL